MMVLMDMRGLLMAFRGSTEAPTLYPKMAKSPKKKKKHPLPKSKKSKKQKKQKARKHFLEALL